VIQEFIQTVTGLQIIDQRTNRHAGPREYGIATVNRWIARDEYRPDNINRHGALILAHELLMVRRGQ